MTLCVTRCYYKLQVYACLHLSANISSIFLMKAFMLHSLIQINVSYKFGCYTTNEENIYPIRLELCITITKTLQLYSSQTIH